MNYKARLAALEKQMKPKPLWESECWREQPDGTFRNDDDGRIVTAEEFKALKRKTDGDTNRIFLSIYRITPPFQRSETA